MKAATDNAGDLIRDLNLVYNKARQKRLHKRFRKLSVEPRLSSPVLEKETNNEQW